MSDIAPDFLLNDKEEKEAISTSELQQLERLVKLQLDQEKIITDLEGKLEVAKKAFNKTSMEDIPNLLNQYALSEIKLRSGQKVIVKEGISVSIPEDKEQLFFAWLKERKEEDIIKLQIAFDKMPAEMQSDLFTFLSGYGYSYDTKKGVHHKTMESYFKRLLGVGDENREQGIKEGKYITVEKVKPFATVFSFFKTTIK